MAKSLIMLCHFLAILSILSRTCVPWFLKLMISLSPPFQQPARTPASPGKVQQQPQAPVKPGGPSPTAPTVQLQTSSAATLPTSSENVAGPAPTEVEVIEIDHVEESNPAPQDTLMEEAIRVTMNVN